MNVNLLHNIYEKSLFENERNINFWEEYLRNLNALDLNVFSEKLTVPVLVPIGNKVLFRGELKHTNEVTVALGAGYFAKCSVHQAEVLRQHRISDAKSHLDLLLKEREYLENHLLLSKQNLNEDSGHDIIEVFTEEEDKVWRKEHRERVRQYKQKKDKRHDAQINEMTDEELWNRLEELELQEEMKNELSGSENFKQIVLDKDKESSLPKEAPDYIDSDDEDDNDGNAIVNIVKIDDNVNENKDNSKAESNDTEEAGGAKSDEEIYRVRENFIRAFMPKQRPKLDLMDQILERHSFVWESLKEMSGGKRISSENAADLLERLDRMEQIDELEDDMIRLEDMIYNVIEAEEGGSDIEVEPSPKKLVSFANGNVILELMFKHSDVEPHHKPYDPKKGIIKPSDVYEAFSKTSAETPSILKKTKYVAPAVESKGDDVEENRKEEHPSSENRRIIVKDVLEKVDHNDNSLSNNARPMSLFKKKRQQKS